MKEYTYHQIKEAVFYSAEKPELLIGLLTDILSNASTGGDSSQITEKLTTLEGKVKTVEGKVSTVEGKVSTVEGKVNTVEGKVNTLETTTVPNLSSKVTALEEKVTQNHPE